MLRIIIADDHSLLRKGLKQILLEEYPAADIAEVNNAEELIKQVANSKWDIVITDIDMPGRSGLDALVQIKAMAPDLPVLVLSIFREEQYAMRVMQSGASGYLSKISANQELILAVRKILLGRKYISDSMMQKLASEISEDPKMAPHDLLSNRELDIMKRLASGEGSSEIAISLSLSSSTISTYRTRLLEKMNLKTNADLTRYAIEHKII